MRHAGAAATVAALLGAAALAGCGSSDTASSPSTTARAGTATGAASATTVASAVTATTAKAAGATGMRGKRYCEVLLVQVIDGNGQARVFNSYPYNDCPADQWQALDAKAIATDAGTTLAVLNGPRYWLMDGIEQQRDQGSLPKQTFGGIEMAQRATVDIGPVATATKPYTAHPVDRATIFTFDAGRTVHELVDADGSTYVMQTWSQQKDPALAEADLDALGARLTLPPGWSYRSRTLTEPLRIDTTGTSAEVLQDDLGNSYSRATIG